MITYISAHDPLWREGQLGGAVDRLLGRADGEQALLRIPGRAPGVGHPDDNPGDLEAALGDLGDDEVAVGDEVLLFGDGSRVEPNAQDWALDKGTIDYEIVTRVGARVPRSYVGET